MDNILSYAASAVQAMSQFALFCIVGLIIGEYPRPHGLLHEQAMSSGTALVFWIFTPCLLLSTFGAKLTPTILQDTLGIILWSLIHCIINYAIGRLFQRIANPREGFHTAYNLSCTFNNAASIPLLLMNALCASPQLSNDRSALDRSTVFIFAYLLPWNLLFWSIGLHITQNEQDTLLQRQKEKQLITNGDNDNDNGTKNNLIIKVDKDNDNTNSTGYTTTDNDNGSSIDDTGPSLPPPPTTNNVTPASSLSSDIQEVPSWNRYHRLYIQSRPFLKKSWTVARKALFTPPMIGIFIGVAIGLIAPLRKALFERGGTLQALGDVITVLGAPSIPVSNLLLAGSLYHGLRDLVALRRAIKHKKVYDEHMEAMRRRSTQSDPNTSPNNNPLVDTIDVEAVILPLSPTTPLPSNLHPAAGVQLNTASTTVLSPGGVTSSSSSVTSASSSASTLAALSPSQMLPRTYSLRITRPRAPTSESLSNEGHNPSSTATSSSSPIVSKIEILNVSTPSSYGNRGRTVSFSSRERSDSNTSSESTINITTNPSFRIPPARTGFGVHQMPAIASITDLAALGAENGLVDTDTDTDEDNEHRSGNRTAPSTPMVSAPVKLNGRQISSESTTSVTSNHNLPTPATLSSADDTLDIPDAARQILERIDVRALVEKLSQEEQAQQMHAHLYSPSTVDAYDNWGYDERAEPFEPDPQYIRHSRVSMALVDPHAHPEDTRTTTARLYRSRLGSLQTDWSSSIFHSPSSTLRRRRSQSSQTNGNRETIFNTTVTTINRNISQNTDTITPSLSQRMNNPVNTASAILLTTTTGTDSTVGSSSKKNDPSSSATNPSSHPPSHVTAILLRRPVLPSLPTTLTHFRPHSEHFLRYKQFMNHYRQPFSPMPTPREGTPNEMATTTTNKNNNDGSSTNGSVPDIDSKEILLTQTEHVSLRTSIILILVKLIIAPIILFALFAACEAANIPVLANSTDPVLRLVIYVEIAAPSAQSVLLLCSMVGNDAAAKDLSLVFLAMYPVSIITQTLFLAVAMSIVFQ